MPLVRAGFGNERHLRAGGATLLAVGTDVTTRNSCTDEGVTRKTLEKASPETTSIPLCVLFHVDAVERDVGLIPGDRR